MRATFHSKRLSQFTTEQNLFVLLSLSSTPLSKMTLAGSVLTPDRQYPEQAMAAVHTFLSPALPHHVPGVMASFGIGETHPSVRATLGPLDAYQRCTCKNVPSPVLQICSMLSTKAPHPPVVLKHMVTAVYLSSRVAVSHPRFSQRPHTVSQVCNTSLSSGFIAGEAAAQTGPGANPSRGTLPTPLPHHILGLQKHQAQEKATNTGEIRPRQAAFNRGRCRRSPGTAPGTVGNRPSSRGPARSRPPAAILKAGRRSPSALRRKTITATPRPFK